LSDGKLENWSPEEVKAAMDQGDILLVDVRTPQEYLLEHIEGAMLFPMADFQAGRLPKQSDKQIVLHCGSGARSKKVGEQCLIYGLEMMAHMEGGFGAWKDKKLPYIGTDMVSGAPKKMPS
jgi:rhodanese-related sulfurtransferase